jgi:hypothetical protein
MGEVYRAKDKRLDRSVAIKVLPAQFSADPVRKQRFEREAKAISSLNHPHICVLHDVGSQDGISYLVVWDVNCGRAGQGASQRCCASGSEAREHNADGGGSEAAGFWIGQASSFRNGNGFSCDFQATQIEWLR